MQYIQNPVFTEKREAEQARSIAINVLKRYFFDSI
jgi:hypothetical protein